MELAIRALRPLAAALTRSQPRLLMYHRFSRAAEGRRRLPVARLIEHVEVARRYCDFVTVRQALERLRGGRPVRRPLVALTVDDGYSDFFEVAWPFLREMGVPVTLYLSVDFVNARRWLWPDALDYLLGSAPAGRITLPLPEGPCHFELSDAASRERAWDVISTRLVYENELRQVVLDELVRQTGVILPAQVHPRYAPLTWEQAREIAASGSELGSHGLSHACMRRLPAAAIRHELAASKATIESHTGAQVVGFAYPNGSPQDVSAHIDALARECGYAYSVCSFWNEQIASAGSFRLGRWAGSENPRYTHNVTSGLSLLRRRWLRREAENRVA